MTELSAKTTSSALRAHVFPLLKAAGFDDWTGRKAWRRREGSIETVEFRSVSAYDAMVIECSTASFSVWLGVWPACFPAPTYPLKSGPKGVRPMEYDMPIRGVLAPPAELAPNLQPKTWKVSSAGDADLVAQAVGELFSSHGLDWLCKDRKGTEILAALQARSGLIDRLEEGPNGSYLHIDCGNTGSPAHKRAIAKVAHSLCQFDLAAAQYEASRWFTSPKTQEKRLLLHNDEDDMLLALIEDCKAGKPPVPFIS